MKVNFCSKLVCGMLLLVFFVNFAVVSSAQEKRNAVDLHGALKVKDGKILNRYDEAPQLRGISLSWSIWGGRNIIPLVR